ncbi:MAG: hypothetical protein PUC29_00590 [Clostridia bacterium]|nr:hypothetical protein [Clostridia bacterium]
MADGGIVFGHPFEYNPSTTSWSPSLYTREAKRREITPRPAVCCYCPYAFLNYGTVKTNISPVFTSAVNSSVSTEDFF